MKNHVRPVLISAIALAVGVCGAAEAQPAAKKPVPPAAVKSKAHLSRAQMKTLVAADLDACGSKTPAVPRDSVREFSVDRVTKTLHGIWRGRVRGDYPKELIAKDGFLNVDYYWIIDARRGEALILEQLSSTRAARGQAAKGAPVWSFITCGREGYVPRHPRQVHEFEKIADTLDGAGRMLGTSTGLQGLAEERNLPLSDAWKRLVETKYFDTKRFGAFAGGLFKPFEISRSKNAAGTPLLSLAYKAEYRGAGDTAARFESGVPIIGKESAGFVGVTTPSGDFLVASLENGIEWAKEATLGGNIDHAIDKVVIGPLVR